MTDSPIIVTGIGRCGTSMTMAMLEAGGFPVLGELPLYDQPMNHFVTGTITGGSVVKSDCVPFHVDNGFAYKLLLPFLAHLDARKSFRFIFCLRDPVQQALSQAKFARLMFGTETTPESLKEMVESNMMLSRTGLKHCREWAGSECFPVRFEVMIREPAVHALNLAEFCQRSGVVPDVTAMTAVIRDRPVECSSDIELVAEPS